MGTVKAGWGSQYMIQQTSSRTAAPTFKQQGQLAASAGNIGIEGDGSINSDVGRFIMPLLNAPHINPGFATVDHFTSTGRADLFPAYDMTSVPSEPASVTLEMPLNAYNLSLFAWLLFQNGASESGVTYNTIVCVPYTSPGVEIYCAILRMMEDSNAVKPNALTSTMSHILYGGICRSFTISGASGDILRLSAEVVGSFAFASGTGPTILTAGERFLLYDAEGAAGFVAGNTVTGATSGATATVAYVRDWGTEGCLTLKNIVGVFQNNENLEVAAVLQGVANGTVGTVYIAYDGEVAAPAVGNTITGATSGATGTLTGIQDDGATGKLVLADVTGVYINNENLQVAAVTKCVANGNSTAYPAMYVDNSDEAAPKDYADYDMPTSTITPIKFSDLTISFSGTVKSIDNFSITFTNSAALRYYNNTAVQGEILQRIDCTGSFTLPWGQADYTTDENDPINDFVDGTLIAFRFNTLSLDSEPTSDNHLDCTTYIRFTDTNIDTDPEVEHTLNFRTGYDGTNASISLKAAYKETVLDRGIA